MPKKKSTDIATATTAFAICSEIESIVASIIEADGECDDETFAQLTEWKAALEVKAENIGLVKLRLEGESAYFKAVEEAARNQRKSRESAVERLKKYFADCMKKADVKSIKKNDGLFSVSLCAGRASVSIPDAAKLPMDYVDIVEQYKPRTDAVKAALEAGKEIPGAALEYGPDYVVVRAK